MVETKGHKRKAVEERKRYYKRRWKYRAVHKDPGYDPGDHYPDPRELRMEYKLRKGPRRCKHTLYGPQGGGLVRVLFNTSINLSLMHAMLTGSRTQKMRTVAMYKFWSSQYNLWSNHHL